MDLEEFLISKNYLFRFYNHHSIIPPFHLSSSGCTKPLIQKNYDISRLWNFQDVT